MLQAVNAVMLLVLGRLDMVCKMQDSATNTPAIQGQDVATSTTTIQGQEAAITSTQEGDNVALTADAGNEKRARQLNNATNSLFFAIALIEAIKMGFITNKPLKKE